MRSLTKSVDLVHFASIRRTNLGGSNWICNGMRSRHQFFAFFLDLSSNDFQSSSKDSNRCRPSPFSLKLYKNILKNDVATLSGFHRSHLKRF